VVVASTALYTQPYQQVDPWTSGGQWKGLPADEHSALASYQVWFTGVAAAFVVIGLWYGRRARRTGMRLPWRRFAGVGLGLLVGLALLAAVPYEPRIASDIQPPAGLWEVRTPLLAVAAAVVVLGWVERSRWLAAAGVWLGLVAWWQYHFQMGGIPGWMSWLLSGFDGPALGGQVTLFGLNRPGPILILATLPLLVFIVARLTRAGSTR
jgi:hypothetical protein